MNFFQFFQNKRRLVILIISILILLLGGGFLIWAKLTGRLGSRADTAKNQPQTEFVSNQILIKVSDKGLQKVQSKHPQTRSEGKPSFSAQDTGIEELNKTNKTFKAKSVTKAFENNKNADTTLDRWYLIDLDVPKKNLKGDLDQVVVENGVSQKVTYRQMLQFYRRTEGVEKAEPNYILHTSMIPNDYFWTTSDYFGNHGDLWNMKIIGSEQAWDKTTGGGVVVAVVDTGVDYNHPDLKNNILRDASNNIIGYDFANNDADPMDDNSHGTHVAGIIAAQGNNDPDHTVDSGTRLIGVGPGLKIMPVKGLGQNDGSESDGMNGIKWAVDHGAKVINNSWGYDGGESQFSQDTVKYAHDKNVVVVFAADNKNRDITSNAPAGDTNAITVGASNYQDGRAAFSNFGAGMDLLAPGGDRIIPWGGPFNDSIISACRANGEDCGLPEEGLDYLAMPGTSMAAPHVAGAAGLVLALHPDWTPEEVRFALRNSADVLNGGWNQKTGSGRLNIAKATALGSAPPVASFSLPDESGWFVKEVTGMVSARSGVKSWSLSMAQANDPAQVITNWTNLASGAAAVSGKLASIDPSQYNGQYILKLVVTDNNNQSSQVYHNANFDNQLLPGWPARSVGESYNVQPAIADINGDGKNEIITTSATYDGIALDVFRADGTELPGFPISNFDWAHFEGPIFNVTSPVIADINNDKKPDIVFVVPHGKVEVEGNQWFLGGSRIYAFDGTGQSIPGWPIDFGIKAGAEEHAGLPTIADLDGDGLPEVLVQTTLGRIFIFKSNGQQLSGWPASMPPEAPLNTKRYFAEGSPTVSDINDDKKMEVIAGYYNKIFIFDSAGKILMTTDPIPADTADSFNLLIADINNDGKKEIIARNQNRRYSSSFLSAFDNTAKQLWSIRSQFLLGFGGGFPVLVKSAQTQGIFVSTIDEIMGLNNNGQSLTGFPLDRIPSSNLEGNQLSVADINNDNKPEIITSGYYPNKTLMAFDISGKTVFQKNYNGAKQTGSIGDVDGDGKLELVANIFSPGRGADGGPESMTYVWKLPDSNVPKNTIAWGQVGGDAQHTATYQPISTTPPPPPSTGLLKNNSFESDLTSWVKNIYYAPSNTSIKNGAIDVINTDCVSGKCVKIQKNNADNIMVSQNLVTAALTAGKTYELSAKFKITSGAATSKGSINIIDSTAKQSNITSLVGTSQWQDIRVRLTPDASNTGHKWAVILYGADAAPGAIIYDDIDLKEVTPYIKNGNLETGDKLWTKTIYYAPTNTLEKNGLAQIINSTECYNSQGWCVKLQKNNSDNIMYSQKIATGLLEANKKYRFSAKYKLTGGSTTSKAYINFYDSTDKKSYSNKAATQGSWQNIAVEFTTTTITAPHAWTAFLYGAESAPGTVLYDDVKLEKLN